MAVVPTFERGYSRFGVVALVFVFLLAGGAVGVSAGEEPVATGADNATTVSPEVLDGEGEQVVLVYFGSDSAGPGVSSRDSADVTVGELKDRAASAQEPLAQHAAATPGVTIQNRFWLGNIAVVTVDHGRADVEALSGIDGVEHVGLNAEVRLDSISVDTGGIDPASPSLYGQASPSLASEMEAQTSGDTTYGLDQINAPDVWSTYGTQGEGTTVAVLDTGVDADHPDIDVTDFAEFNETGHIVGTDPYDSGEHGTHVSGTVVGGDASGTHLGVAPGADLMHGLVLPNGEGTLARVVAGMEWAVDNDADVISMSLGGNAYIDEFIKPVRDAQNAGTMVVAASGNDGGGTSHSPGNVYDATSVGASDATWDIADISGGETVERSYWDDPPGDWPAEWVAPTVSAPGVAVESAVPGGGTGTETGTSMATPHVAGAVALIQSATDRNLTITEIETALTDTAFKPAGVPPDPDARYGHGIVDVKAAVDSLSDQEPDPAQFDVTVDATNSPVTEGETLEVDATVENTGEATDSQTITLDVDGVRDATDVTLAGGESQTVTLEWTTGTGDAGEYSAAVFSEDDTDSTGVTVREAAAFTISLTETNSPVIEGDTLTVDATIENTGAEADTQSITLGVDGERDSTTVTLAGGESQTVTLEWATVAGDNGSYTATVASDDDTDTIDVTVREPGLFVVTISETNSPVVSDDTLVVNATVESTVEGTDTQRIRLTTNGTERDATNLTLDRGETSTVSLAWNTTGDDVGSYAATVASETDDDEQAVTVEKPGDFGVTIGSTSAPVTEGEQLSVDVVVENTGNGTATQTVTLTANDTQQSATDVTLAPGERTTVSLAWATSGGDAGERTVTVASEDSTDSTAVVVEKAVPVAVAITATNAPVEEGETLTVEATLENTGNENTTQTVALRVDGTERDSTRVTLTPAETTAATLAWTPAPGDAGDRTVTVASVRDAATVTVAVEAGEPRLADYANDADIVDTAGLRTAIDDWRAGDIDTALLRDVIDAWRSGKSIE
ncbi:MAG: S8 family serine peptidase [Halovenus sp.]